MLTRDTIFDTLKRVEMPGFPGVSILRSVRDMQLDARGNVDISLGLGHMARDAQIAAAQAVEQALMALPDVGEVMVRVVRLPMPHVHPPTTAESHRERVVIAVGSGKGGVGKSTVAVNLAVALAQQGLQVGLLDADLYGPNVPRMLGVEALPRGAGDGRIPPAEAHGIRAISIGWMVTPERAVVWRGPMTDKILRQFLDDVAWGELDVLVVDLPPGTGDIALGVAKHAKPSAAIVVTTPQAVAADDARKAITMFERLEIPVLGIVENMAYFRCPTCDDAHRLWGEGGAAQIAAERDLPVLATLPLEPAVGQGGDDGHPIVLDEASESSRALRALAQRVAAALPVPQGA